MSEEIKNELKLANEYITAMNKVKPENQEDHENIRVHLMKIESIIDANYKELK